MHLNDAGSCYYLHIEWWINEPVEIVQKTSV